MLRTLHMKDKQRNTCVCTFLIFNTVNFMKLKLRYVLNQTFPRHFCIGNKRTHQLVYKKNMAFKKRNVNISTNMFRIITCVSSSQIIHCFKHLLVSLKVTRILLCNRITETPCIFECR